MSHTENMERLQELISAQTKGHEKTAVECVGRQLLDIARHEPASAELLVKDLEVSGMGIAEAEKKIKEAANGKIESLTTELDEERNKPAPEPLEKVVVTHQPSPEQIDAIRAEEAAKADKRIEDLQKAQQIRIDAILSDKKRVEDALVKVRKASEDAEDEMAALTEKHEAELAALNEKHEAELKAAREEGNADAETAAEAAKRIEELEKSLKMANPAVSEFRGLFEAANSLIVALKSKLNTVRCTDPEAADKLDKAMAALAALITRKEATA